VDVAADGDGTFLEALVCEGGMFRWRPRLAGQTYDGLYVGLFLQDLACLAKGKQVSTSRESTLRANSRAPRDSMA
jgi:hypothetical protein